MEYIWIFIGVGGRFPSGVFSSKEQAEQKILESKLTGMLTKYPVDYFVVDWAIERGFFSLKSDDSIEARRQVFSSASLEHYHYENGAND